MLRERTTSEKDEVGTKEEEEGVERRTEERGERRAGGWGGGQRRRDGQEEEADMARSDGRCGGESCGPAPLRPRLIEL